MSQRLRRPNAVLVYYVFAGVQALASATMFTVNMVYFVTSVGLNPLQLVLVGTVLESTYFLFEVPTGVVADTYSRRLSVIIGILLLGVSFVWVGAVPIFAAILLGQVIAGLGYTFTSGATEAWLADEVGEENVGRVYLRSGQIERALGLVGTGASVALASVRLNLPLLLGGAMYLALGLFLILAMPEHGFKRAPRGTGPRNAFQAMAGTFRAGTQVLRGRHILLMLMVVEFFVGASSEGYDRLGDAHLLTNFTFPALGALKPVVWFGILSAAGSVLSIVTTEVFRRRMEAISRVPSVTARILLVLNGLSIAGTLVFALAGNFPMAFAALMAKGVVGSLYFPLYNAWIVQNIEPKVRATVLSMVGQTNALGQILGGPGVGAIGTVASLRTAIALTGVLQSPILGLYLSALRRGGLEKRPTSVPATESQA